MQKKTPVWAGLLFPLAAVALAPSGRSSPAQAANPTADKVPCRVIEVFLAERIPATAVIFHQRDEANRPRLGELLLAHSGEEVAFQTPDGKRHGATVFRVKSCFGRGLLLLAPGEAKLSEKDEFVLWFPGKR